MKTKYIQPEISILKAYGKEFIMQNGVVTGSQIISKASKIKGVENKGMAALNDLIDILKAYGKKFIMQNGVVTGSQKTANISKINGAENKEMAVINDYLEKSFADEKPYITDSDKNNLITLWKDAKSNNIDDDKLLLKMHEMIEEALQKNFREQVKELKLLFKTKKEKHKKTEDYVKYYYYKCFIDNNYSNADGKPYLSDSEMDDVFNYLKDNTNIFSDKNHIEEELMKKKDEIDEMVQEVLQKKIYDTYKHLQAQKVIKEFINNHFIDEDGTSYLSDSDKEEMFKLLTKNGDLDDPLDAPEVKEFAEKALKEHRARLLKK